jgi:hypothetical protein
MGYMSKKERRYTEEERKIKKKILCSITKVKRMTMNKAGCNTFTRFPTQQVFEQNDFAELYIYARSIKSITTLWFICHWWVAYWWPQGRVLYPCACICTIKGSFIINGEHSKSYISFVDCITTYMILKQCNWSVLDSVFRFQFLLSISQQWSFNQKHYRIVKWKIF